MKHGLTLALAKAIRFYYVLMEEICMKKKISLIVAGIMMVSVMFTGCQSKNSSETTAVPTPTPVSKEADTSKETKAETKTDTSEDEKVEFTWMHHLQEVGKQDWIQNSVKEYTAKHPNVTINIENVKADQYTTMLKTKIASGDAPMIFDLDRSNTIEFTNAGHLADVSDIEGLKENFDEQILAQGQVNSSQYGVPLDVNGYGVFYNKDIFQKYGLSIPKTNDELLQVCETLSKNGVTPLGAAFSEAWCLRQFFTAYLDIFSVESNSEWYTQKMALKNNFSNDKAFKDAMSTVYSYKKYWGSDPFSTSWNDVLNKLATGEVAMTINASWTIDGVLGINPEANLGTFAVPVSNDPAQTKIRIKPGNNYCVYKNEDEKKLAVAKDFFAYLCSKESAEYYAVAAHGLTGCNVDVDVIEPINDITAYEGDYRYVQSAVTTFNSAYLTSIEDLTTQFMMEKSFDVNAYAQKLDKAFAAVQ